MRTFKDHTGHACLSPPRPVVEEAGDIVLRMSYTVRIFAAEDIGDAEREQTGQRFKAALEGSLGDAGLVEPVYRIWLRLYQAYGDHPRPWPISDAEQLLADQWEAAEMAATQAAFGVNRYMGDAYFELDVGAD